MDGLGPCGGTARKVCDALMRAYRKTTHHPICVYLTEDEAAELTGDAADASNRAYTYGEEPSEALTLLGKKLRVLLSDPKKERA